MIAIAAGEDGFVKIYSRSGMLRSTLVKASLPVLTSCWSPDCSMILYSQGGNLLLQPFNSNSKPHKVKKRFSCQRTLPIFIQGFGP